MERVHLPLFDKPSHVEYTACCKSSMCSLIPQWKEIEGTLHKGKRTEKGVKLERAMEVMQQKITDDEAQKSDETAKVQCVFR